MSKGSVAAAVASAKAAQEAKCTQFVSREAGGSCCA